MSRKKRFEQIEAANPGEREKLTIFQRFSFKRKLEIHGVERERLPEQQSALQPPSPDPGPVDVRTGDSKLVEARVELETMAKEAEVDELKRQARDARLRTIIAQKKIEKDRKNQVEEARKRVEHAKSRISTKVIVIRVLLFLVVLFIVVISGTGRRFWRRW